MKAKKITTKFYLNENIKEAMPVQHSYADGHTESYYSHPLYIQVIFERNNTKFKCLEDVCYFRDISEVERQRPGLMESDRRVIEKTIRFEVDNNYGRFNIQGLNLLYKRNRQSTHTMISDYLVKQLKVYAYMENYLYASLINFNEGSRNFFLLYNFLMTGLPGISQQFEESFKKSVEAAYHYFQVYAEKMMDVEHLKKMMPMGFYGQLTHRIYDEPCLIDWLDGSHKEELNKRFRAYSGHINMAMEDFYLELDKMIRAEML